MVSDKLAKKVCEAIAEQKLWPLDMWKAVKSRTGKDYIECGFVFDEAVSSVDEIIGDGMYEALGQNVDDYAIVEIDGSINVIIRKVL